MRLYWVDAFFDKIEHSNFDGRNRVSLNRITHISHPFGLTIFEGMNLFFANEVWYIFICVILKRDRIHLFLLSLSDKVKILD